METRICKKCGIEKNIDGFYYNSSISYRKIVCKDCENKYSRERYKKQIAEKNFTKIERETLLKQGLRKCDVCNKIKNINEFGNRISPKNGKLYYDRRCIDCEQIRRQNYCKNNREKENQRHREYCAKNRERMKPYIDAYNKKYREEHKEELKLKRKIYVEQHKEEIAEKMKKYNLQNREELNLKRNERMKKRMENDPVYKLRRTVKQNIRIAFVKKGYRKSERTEKILGCDFKFFYNYLLETYKKNYGYEWDGIEPVHIDHIYPISKAKTEEEVIKLCHYTNLQLLKKCDNLKKSNKLDFELI